MGIVFKAKDLELEETVALKMIRPELSSDQDIVKKFKRELQLARKINHDNIIRIHDLGEIEGIKYISMNYIEGQTLEDLIQTSGKLTIEKTIDVINQICSALSVAHDKNIIHRDLKPQNIMLDKKGKAYVMDFGLARSLEATGITKTGIALGTPSFISPEQAQGEKGNIGSDIYSLGIIIYKMVTGKLPFKADSPLALLQKHLTEKPVSPQKLNPQIPKFIDKIIMKCLEKKLEDRYSKVEDILKEIEEDKYSADPSSFKKSEPIFFPKPQKLKLKIMISTTLIIIVIAISVWLLLRKTDLPAGQEQTFDAKKILITLFDNQTNDSSMDLLGHMILESMIQKFMEFGKGEMVPATTAVQISKTLQNRSKDLEKMNFLKELTKETDAGIVVTGSFYKDGEKKLLFHASITDLATQKLVYAIEPLTRLRGARSEMINTLVQRVLGALAIYYDSRFINLGAFKSPTFDAYREGMKGFKIFNKDYLQGIRHLERAAELDPDFIIARLVIVSMYFALGQYEKGDRFWKSLKLKPVKFTFLERIMVEALEAWSKGNWSRCLKLAEQVNKYLPTESWVAFATAIFSVVSNRPGQAAAIYEKVGEAFFTTGHISFTFLTSAYHMLGEYEKELKVAREGRKWHPGRLQMLTYEVRALAALGSIEQLHGVLDQSMSIASREGTPGEVMVMAATELREHKHMNAYREIAGKAVAWYESKQREEPISEYQRYKYGLALYVAEQWEKTESIFKKLAAGTPDDVELKGILGAIFARKGDRRAGERIMAELNQMDRPYIFGEHTFWQARIAALLGEKEQAIQLLREAFSQGLPYGPFLLGAMMDLESLRDHPSFKELLSPKG